MIVMKTYTRICIKDYSITDGDNTFKISKGKEYLTSTLLDDGNVVVLSNYGIRAPITIFRGEVPAYRHSIDRLEKNKDLLKEQDYKKGFLDGIECFAWWKDGEQLVGTTGITLEEAKSDLFHLWTYNPPQKVRQKKKKEKSKNGN